MREGDQTLSERLSRRDFLQRLALAGAAVGAGGLLGACGDDGEGTTATTAAGGPANTSPLKIGFMTPLSGVFAGIGTDLRDGFQAYIDEHQGAIGGRPVTVVVEDTEANPEVGLRKAQKLLRQDRVELVVGIVSSAVALGVRDLFHEEEVPLIVSNAGANDTTRKAKSPFVFRTSFSNWQPNFAAGKWVYDNVTKDGVFVMDAHYAAGREATAGFSQGYETARRRILADAYPPFRRTQG